MKSEVKSTFPFLESIGIWGGKAPYLHLHQERVNRTFSAHFPNCKVLDLRQLFGNENPKDKNYKWRVRYNQNQSISELLPFPTRKVQNIQLMRADAIEYPFKFSNRDALDHLYKQRNEGIDEILILRKGLLTDAYYYNAVVKIKDQLFTPEVPLLEGVMRTHLINKNVIRPKALTIEHLQSCEGVYLINALHPLASAPWIPRKGIEFPEE